uniref:Uncharacterized protein n=1 Tax=Ditylenchus dipsaci TaxID=166011 RepID=A0A915DJ06_9BILA
MKLFPFVFTICVSFNVECESILQDHGYDDSLSEGCPLTATSTTKSRVGDLCVATEFLLHTKGNAPVSDGSRDRQNRWWCSESYFDECEYHPPTPPNAYLLMPPAAHLKPRVLWIRQFGWLSGDPRIEYKIDALPNILECDSINHEMDGLIYDPKEMTLRLFIRKPHLGYSFVLEDDQQYVLENYTALIQMLLNKIVARLDLPSSRCALKFQNKVYFQDNIQREGSNGKAIYAVPLKHIYAFLDDEASPAEFTSKLITTVYQDNPFGLVEVTGGTLHFDWNKPPRFLAVDALDVDKVCLKYFIEMTNSCFAVDVEN